MDDLAPTALKTQQRWAKLLGCLAKITLLLFWRRHKTAA
jgi:hypothetical protein